MRMSAKHRQQRLRSCYRIHSRESTMRMSAKHRQRRLLRIDRWLIGTPWKTFTKIPFRRKKHSSSPLHLSMTLVRSLSVQTGKRASKTLRKSNITPKCRSWRREHRPTQKSPRNPNLRESQCDERPTKNASPQRGRMRRNNGWKRESNRE